MDKLNSSYTELLITIFDLSHEPKLYSDTRSSVAIPLVLSHVCHRWREVILDLPHHWTRIHLSHKHFVPVSHNLLQRSASQPLSLALDFTDPYHRFEGPKIPDSPDLEALITVVADPSVISRLRDLRLSAPYTILSVLTARAPQLLSLRNLVIRQADDTQTETYLGPLSFNSEVFRSLTLEGVGIRLSDPSDISGIQCLSLLKAPQNLLDQTRLLDPDNPTPGKGPCMTELSELRLARGPRSVDNLMPYTPSFESRNLKYIYLANYPVLMPRGVFGGVFNPLILEELELNNVNLSTLAPALGLARQNSGGVPMPFVRLHTLTIQGTKELLWGVTHYVLRSFPELRLLRLLDTAKHHTDIFENLLRRDTQLCPFLASFWANGIEFPRRSIAMIAAPPGV